MYIWLSAYHQDKAIAIKRPIGHIVHRSYPYTSTIIKGLFVTKASVCHLHLPPPPPQKKKKKNFTKLQSIFDGAYDSADFK